MSKLSAWITALALSLGGGALFLPIAHIAGVTSWAISIVVLPLIVGIVIWKRTPAMLDSGLLLIPAGMLASLPGVYISFVFFCNVNLGMCNK